MSDIVTVTPDRDAKKLFSKVLAMSRFRFETQIGFMRGSKYDDGTPVAEVAYYNEYGAGHNPKRPFLKETFDRNHRKWAEGMARQIKGQIHSRSAVWRAYEMVGEVAVGDVKETIKRWSPSDPRPNKPATVAAKARRAKKGQGKASNPKQALIDTGVMIANVRSKVKE